MPVRRIPKNYLTVTGAFSSKKNDRMQSFESLLERDYMLLLEFDPDVESFEEQPVTIPLGGKGRSAKKYVPDVLVKYHNKPAELTEVKPSQDLERNAEKYSAKFEQAEQYAQDHDWVFTKTTEREIRGSYLQNLKFLREYRNIQPAEQDVARVIEVLQLADGELPVDALLQQLGSDDSDILHWAPVVWFMLVTGQLAAVLDEPLSMQSMLYLPQEAAS
ncbi:TnsA endonuclease N-terminal domain-containing protein [Chitinibacter sp. S2-10]|uniref:TnsA endonuclease N-terminal domain-containing protein n=1 Tax=Chitinibacter sp. S2-10 TaxID=3373597 RepID=UPI0039778722